MPTVIDSHILEMTTSLASNFAVITAAMLFYLVLLDRSVKIGSKVWSIIVGSGFGLLCVVSMLAPIQIREGIATDARFVLAMVSTIYGGPISGLVSILIASSFRLIKGGIGFYASNPTLMSALFLGVLFLYINIPLERRFTRVFLFSIFGLLLFFLQVLSGLTFLWFKPWAEVKEIIIFNNLPALFIYPPMTAILGACLDFIASRYRLSELQRATTRENNRLNMDLKVLNSALYHELRTPLVTIQGFLGEAHLHLNQNKNDSVYKDLSYIQSAADRMSALIIAITKLNKMSMITEVTPTLLKELIKPIQIHWPSLQIMDPRSFRIGCDSRTFWEIFSPLIENAFKFIPPSRIPDVRLFFSEDNGMLRFELQDNGIGFENNAKEHLFDLFRKEDALTPGIGAGLAIVKRIVERLHGRIQMESAGIDKGCLVQVWLPLVEK